MSKNPKNGEVMEIEAKRRKCDLPNLRQFKSLPIVIVENHHEVLEFIFRIVGSRHFPKEDGILVHFDSHPDMVISRNIAAADTFKPDKLMEESSIENWIMPLCYTGIISRIVWIKNNWCNQIPNGKYNFKIGEHNGKMFVDLNLPYFLSEGSYCDTENLSNARSIELFVMDASEIGTAEEEAEAAMKELDFLRNHSKEPSYLLDIDLDFFSVNNPFISLYEKSNCYEQLQNLFALEIGNDAEIDDDATAINERRLKKLDALEDVFHYLEKHSSLDNYERPTDEPSYSFELLQKLVDSLKDNYPAEDIEWTLVYDAGCTADSGGLPHHNATKLELNTQFERFKCFLTRLPYLPVGVTIARSVEDDYCPAEQVEEIQENVLKCIESVLGTKKNQIILSQFLEDDEPIEIYEL